jgi:rhamnosyl/mannosyltransferase
MRILHVGKFYAPHKGGMETALRLMAEGLVAQGHEVRVIVAGRGRRTERGDLPGAPGALVRLGVIGACASQPVTVGMVPELRRQLREFRPDVVQIHTPNPLACGAWRCVGQQARRQGVRLAIWHHSDIVRQRLLGTLVAPVVRRALAEADGIAVSSAHLRDTSRELIPWRQKVSVIPFGIDPEPFAALQPGAEGPFVFVGRLVGYKGLDILFDALGRVPEARLDIVGDGPLRSRLARRVRDENLAHRVRLLGELSDEQLVRLLGASRALVLPSRDQSETFGLSLLEAMAAGLPLIASDLPTGVRDLVRPGHTGWLAAPGDADDLAAALTACLSSPQEARARGEAGRALMRERFTRQRFAQDLGQWYADLRAPGR